MIGENSTNFDDTGKKTSSEEVGDRKAKNLCSSGECTSNHCFNGLHVSKEPKDSTHLFWDSQPVPKSHEVISEGANEAIDKVKSKSEIRATPMDLPSFLCWSDVNINDEKQLNDLYELLKDHYVKDDENLFQFAYPKEFLLWTLKPPGHKPSWHVGVREVDSGEMVGFIAAIPVKIKVFEKVLNCVEINFLCLKEVLRNKRLAPVLIQEITRRVNLYGIFQAIHTAGHLYSQPFTKATYYHRSLNIKKLIDTKFGSKPEKMTMKMAIKLHSLPELPKIAGFRQMKSKDVASTCNILSKYLEKFKVHAIYDQVRFRHEFMHKGDCVQSFVVEKNGEITDFISFYSLPSSVLNHKVHKTLNVAYLYSIACTETTPQDLIMDCLITAKNKGFDVFNALDLMENQSAFEKLKFNPGSGVLKYYFFNWLCPSLPPSDVSLVLQ